MLQRPVNVKKEIVSQNKVSNNIYGRVNYFHTEN